MTVYVVSFDHPSYAHGIEDVFLKRADAVKCIKECIEAEYLHIKDFERCVYETVTCYSGEGNADGIYYYITRTVLK